MVGEHHKMRNCLKGHGIRKVEDHWLRTLGAFTIQLKNFWVATNVSFTLRESYSSNIAFWDKIAILGLDANGDGDKSHENAALSALPEAEQSDMSTLALDHSEYEPLPESNETGKPILWIWFHLF